MVGQLPRLNVSLATMKYTSARPLADPETGARKLVEIASGIQPVQDGRVFIELINVPFLKQGGTGEQFSAAVALAQERGWLELHESGTYVRLPAQMLARPIRESAAFGPD
ncbi:hypothetical protein GCM10007858_72110 [Bradyrhizobium liaoningense]|nr:hypothetical protein GCM10007858_72110 [Bradyrhizobium liaoningense]